MKFRTLSLTAFGPFDRRQLDFGKVSAPGLHVVYGPNEAGKSSALRAVRGLLFGIPHVTPDDHRHPASELRIGACVELPDGTELEFVRHKKRKDSLRDGKDQPLDDGVIGQLLGGLDQASFDALYGFDHRALKAGGDALISGGGAVGSSLYDAAVGGRGIARVLAELRAEAADLFNDNTRAKKPRLNAAIDRYQQVAKEQRAALVPPQKWQEQLRAREAAEQEVTRLKNERQALRAERERVTRILQLLGPHAKRQLERERLAALGTVVSVSDAQFEQSLRAERQREQAASEESRLVTDRSRSAEQLEQLSVPEALTRIDPARIAELQNGIGSHRKAARDLPVVRSTIRAAEDEARSVLRQLGLGEELDGAERLRVSAADAGTIRTLSQRRPAITEKLRSLEQKLAELVGAEREQRALLSALEPPRSSAELEAALQAARTGSALLAQLEDTQQICARLSADLDRELGKLGRWRGTVHDLLALELPPDEAIDAFAQATRDCEDQIRRRSDEAKELRGRLAQVDRDLKALTLEGEVPDEAQLGAARQRRQAVWSLVKRSWLADEDVTRELAKLGIDAPLHEALESLTLSADELSDRLRREAARVAARARLAAEREYLLAETTRTKEELARAQGELVERSADWEKLWLDLGIEPSGPAEMRAFVRRARGAVQLASALAQAERTSAELEARRAALTTRLQAALGGSEAGDEPELDVLLVQAEARVQEEQARRLDLRTSKARAAELAARIEQARLEIERARADAVAWQTSWQGAVAVLGRGAELEPEVALQLLDLNTQLFTRLDALPTQRRRVAGIERDAAHFEREVQELAQVHAPDLLGRPADEAAEHLVRRYQEACALAGQRTQLRERLEQLEQELTAQRGAQTGAQNVLDQLHGALHVTSHAELVALYETSREAQRLEQNIRELEQQLVEIGGGISLRDIERELSEWDRVRALARQQQLDEELSAADEALEVARDRFKGLEAGLESYGAGRAAEFSEELQAIGARIRDGVENYARAKIALTILEREIERYRERNQGPVLARANQLFPRLTLGRYVGLRVGVEERVLRCVRKDGREVEVQGLSEGTCYQLYFALRLATLERHLSERSPVPIVLDDVFIHFDDERSAAALAVLGELAQRTQVLFFTHHRRLLDLARSAVPKHVLGLHDLEPSQRVGAQLTLLGSA